ncbi:hypothetical protein BRADI_3g33352v3 [Brachypodium distachyon]|uniref:Uncharacterized protein n=1 Tax=Brachypodium distachyon TaxID=15368 RepID=A0A2K2D0T4_BRADI|nr:hypothetical protein BRADI_3g33352v3 [Brachypodium distachyon]
MERQCSNPAKGQSMQPCRVSCCACMGRSKGGFQSSWQKRGLKSRGGQGRRRRKKKKKMRCCHCWSHMRISAFLFVSTALALPSCIANLIIMEETNTSQTNSCLPISLAAAGDGVVNKKWDC